MPWKALSMSESRAAFVALARSGTVPFAEACRAFAVSRKTGYKWLRRAQGDPAAPLEDLPRRPHRPPRRTPDELEHAALGLRDAHGWGARKIHARLRALGLDAPSPRTITEVLRRHGRLRRPAPPAAPPQRFERAAANDLWQADFKGPLYFGRRKLQLFDVLDDHSRFALACELVEDQTMATAWAVLWRLFGEAGLPEALLCDNAFAAAGRTGLSWFDARLVRLGIRPAHGRPYHPQTQGKVERFHGTLQAEAFGRLRWDDPAAFAAGLREWRVGVYNAVRPHEALGDAAPVTRWRPSPRRRPAGLPAVEYEPGAVLRKVMQKGEVSWRGCEILVGAGIAGEWVRVQESDDAVRLFYSWKEIRAVRVDQLRKRAVV